MLAEHVIAPARYAAIGRIGLRALPGGFGTPPFPGSSDGDRQVLERSGALVVRDGVTERRAPITTLREAAEFVGIDAGAPASVYPPNTPLEIDRRLVVDVDSEKEISNWFALGNEALLQLRSLTSDADPSEIQLWPEHFDIAATIDQVNYGASPGDVDHPAPYLYVGPFEARTGSFWNESFGASRTRDRVTDVAAALDFFQEGRDLTA